MCVEVEGRRGTFGSIDGQASAFGVVHAMVCSTVISQAVGRALVEAAERMHVQAR